MKIKFDLYGFLSDGSAWVVSYNIKVGEGDHHREIL